MSGWLFLDGRGVLFEVAPRDRRARCGLPPGAAPTDAALRAALAAADRAVPDPERTRSVADERSAWREYWRAFLHALALPETHAAVLQREAHWHRHARVYPDAPAALSELRGAGYRLGLLSNGPPSLAEGLTYLGLRHLFSLIVTSGESGFRKPDARIFRLALSEAGVGPSSAWFVDDQPAHVRAAANLGMRALLLDRSGAGGDLSRLTQLPLLMAT